MKRKYLYLILTPVLVMCNYTLADSIRTSDGITCTFDSSDTPYELTTYIENGRDDSDYNNQGGYYNSNEENSETKGGVEFVYRFGGSQRLDCDKLYQLELRTKEQKVKMLEMKLRKMEAMMDVQWE